MGEFSSPNSNSRAGLPAAKAEAAIAANAVQAANLMNFIFIVFIIVLSLRISSIRHQKCKPEKPR